MTSPPASEITVVGAGGIGCSLAHALAKGGLDVLVVDADEQKVQWGRSNGIGVDDQRPAQARFEHFQQWTPPAEGIVLLCTKCYDNASVIERLGDGLQVIPVQNGFDRELAQRCRFEGIASYVSQCTPGQTHTRITRDGDLHIGPCNTEHDGTLPPDIASLVDALERHGDFQVQRVRNVLPYKYAKLMYNAAISPLAAVTGLDNGRLLTMGRARTIFFTFLRENYGILKQAGIELGRIGPFHPDTVNRILRLPLVARAMAPSFARSLRNTYCSMSGDIERGRTEIDNFNGHLVELAGSHACELNRRACSLVKRMEQERAIPSLDRLDELAA